jgi:NAD(P)H-dependent FMN reductase
MKILAISGSLRAASSNTALLRALALLALPPLEISLYEGLAGIPPFNPDLDSEPGPEPVEAFRAALRRADAVVVSTPEYAHGIPGSLKNLLDWVVGSGELSEKPVALIHASARGEHAQASLREVLRTMNARLLSDVETTLSLMGPPRSPAEISSEYGHAAQIRSFLQKLAELRN